ncbi:BREX-1 system adenine-specific DNA-methyltransferase PglX [Clostridium sp. AM32-2]|nr:BREX-1 system adenine-specific DNA-methyltransferase PglX [Clostridium sp. AM32-2]RHT27681.1 BREX-1 system adenine-specific DNA-methyltransferase PglX [Clostridium sp. AM32-2]
MDKNAIKKFAVWARTELIARVSLKGVEYGITEDNIEDANADSVGGKVLTANEKKQRQALIAEIKDKGYKQVMEEVAYTWFNRFSALRFMEVNGYLPSHVRVFTDEENNFKPQIITEAIHMDLDGLDMEKVYELKDAEKTEELYKYLLIVQCNALNKILPGMFQKIADYTELLLPDNLLREGSVIEQMIKLIPENDWKDAVQIIGWLYQFYNTEPKQEVDAKVKKGIKVIREDIPAKTQIFTPDWVVRYMVENSLGRIWQEGHPSDELSKNWKYYMQSAKQDENVEKIVDAEVASLAELRPEDIKCIDPCMGSGHILVYMFDILMQIYEVYGYTTREAVASIIENNIYGLDIDERAAQLAYFSVMMKARQYDRRFFSRGIQPYVYAVVESNHVDKFVVEYFCNNNSELMASMNDIISEMKDAKDYGSLTHVSTQNWTILYERFSEILDDINIYREVALRQLLPLVQVAEILSCKYHVVITNPPYLGGGGMNETLAEFARDNYFEAKNDMFAIFIERGNELALPGMFNCMVTMQSWMFLSSYEKLRKKILDTKTIETLLHMDNQVMGIAFGTAVVVLKTKKIENYKGTYNYIYYSDIVEDTPVSFPVVGNRYAQVSDEYYRDIPGSPIAYWISSKTRDSFLSEESIGTVAPPKQGLATADNERFLRLWHEVDIQKIGFGISSCDEAETSGKKFFPYNKGGAFRRWYGNRDYVVNWENDGYEIKNFKDDKGKVRSRPQNLQYYFKPAITWSDVTSGSFSGRYAEQGFMFDIKGSSGFPDKELLPYVLGLLNSKVAQAFIKILNPTMTTQVGDMTRIPVIKADVDEITLLSKECIDEAKADWDSFETSWDFKIHPLIRCGGKQNSYIKDAFESWALECEQRFRNIKENEEKLNQKFIEIYGLAGEISPEVNEKYITVSKAYLERDIRSFISYAVGCMFGRYSLDVDGLVYAGGDWDASKYASFAADKDNIIPICDDEYFEDDIVGLFVEFVKTVYGEETLDENLKFIADALGGKGQPKDVIRDYFLNGFYTDHCSKYSVTGSGKRPIYWLFDSGKKNGFKALIYMHRYQPDTIARIRTDYVHEQQARYRTVIADLEQRIANASTGERVKLNKKLTTLQAQDTEIRTYEEKIHHLADQMISIDLDDGVKKNYAIFQDILAKIK